MAYIVLFGLEFAYDSNTPFAFFNELYDEKTPPYSIVKVFFFTFGVPQHQFSSF
jgi:hypothetical protein